MKRFLQIFSVMLLSCLAVVLFGIATKPQAKADDACPGIANPYSFINATVIQHCGDKVDYYYSPTLTAKNNNPIFVRGTFDSNSKVFTADSNNQGIVIIQDSNNDANVLACVVTIGGAQSGCSTDNNLLGTQQAKSVVTELKDFCAVTQSGTCKDITNNQTVTNPSTSFTAKIGAIQSAQGSIISQQGCEQDIGNALSFFLCPLSDAITKTVDGLVGFLKDQLTIAPLTDSVVRDGFDRFRTIANSLYIIIFLIIIFSNFFSTGLDNYSIKKMLPRLLVAVIATQFGFLICALIVDLSNIVAVAIPSAVAPGQSLGQAIGSNYSSFINSGSGNSGVQALAGIGYFIVVLILTIAILIIVIVALAYLVFRNVFLIVLVFVSPLAFAAWVLPQTQQYAKKWGVWYLKLVLMGPIIGLILAVTVVITSIFSKAPDGSFLKFISVFIPFLGLAVIPKSLKWSGDVMTTTGKAVQDSTVGKGVAKNTKESLEKGAGGKVLGKGVAAVGGKIPGFKTSSTKFGAKKEAAYKSAQTENYGAFGVDDLVKLSSASGATGKNARAALGRKRSEMGYELSRNANNGLAPSEKQLKDLRKMNEALAKEGEPAILPNIPTGTAMPTDPEGNNWSDTVNMVQPGNNGPVVNGGTGGSSTPTTPPPAPPSGGGSSGSPAGSSGGGTPSPAGPTPGQRAANASAGGRQRRQQAAASNPNAGQFNQRIADESVDVPTANQQVDDAAQRARDIIDSLNNPKPPTTP